VLITSVVVAGVLSLCLAGAASAQTNTYANRAAFEAAGARTVNDLDARNGAVPSLFGGRLVFTAPHPEAIAIAWPGGQPVQGKALVSEPPASSASIFITFPTPVYGFGVDLYDGVNGAVNTITVGVTTTSNNVFGVSEPYGLEGYAGFVGVTVEEGITAIEISINGSAATFYADNLTLLDPTPTTHTDRLAFEALGEPATEDFDAHGHGTAISSLFGGVLTTVAPLPTIWVETFPGGQPVQGGALVAENRGDAAHKIIMNFSPPVMGVGGDLYDQSLAFVTIRATTTDLQVVDVGESSLGGGYEGFHGVTAPQGITQVEIIDLLGGSTDILIDNLTVLDLPPGTSYSDRTTFEAAGIKQVENFNAIADNTPVASIFSGRVLFLPTHPTVTQASWTPGQPVQGGAIGCEPRGASSSIFISFLTPVLGIGADIFDESTGTSNVITMRVSMASGGTFDVVESAAGEGNAGFVGATATDGISSVEFLIDGTVDNFYLDNVTILDAPAPPPDTYVGRAAFEAMGAPTVEDFAAYADGEVIGSLFGGYLVFAPTLPAAFVGAWEDGIPFVGPALAAQPRFSSSFIVMDFPTPIYGVGGDVFDGYEGTIEVITLRITTTSLQTTSVSETSPVSGYAGFLGATSNEGIVRAVFETDGTGANLNLDNLTVLNLPRTTGYDDRALFEAEGAPMVEDLEAFTSDGTPIVDAFGGQLSFSPPLPTSYPGSGGTWAIAEPRFSSGTIEMTFSPPVLGIGADLLDEFSTGPNDISLVVTTTNSETGIITEDKAFAGNLGFIGITSPDLISVARFEISSAFPNANFWIDNITILGVLDPLTVPPTPIVVGLSTNETTSQILTITNTTGADIPFTVSKRLDPGVGTPFLAPALSDATLAVVQEATERFVPSAEYGEMPSSEPAGTPSPASSSGFGDVINVFNNFPMTTTGMVWANGTLYVVDYDDEQILTYDPGTQTATFFATTPTFPQTIVWDGTYLWVGDCAGDQYAYDLAGVQVGSMNTPVRDCHSTAFDGTDFLVCSDRTINPVIYRVDHAGAILGEYHTSHSGFMQSMVWVPEHAAGATGLVDTPGHGLWAYDHQNGWIARFRLVDGPDNIGFAQLTTAFFGPVGGINGYSLAHDGTDMWWSHFNGTTDVWQLDDGTDDIPWVTPLPAAGTVPANSTFDVTLDFNAYRLPGGSFGAEIVVGSGGPDAVATTQLDVLGIPDIETVPNLVVFSDGFVGGTETKQIMVTNRGGEVLDITGIAAVDPYVTVYPAAMQLGPGLSQPLYITYAPTDPSQLGTAVQLNSNDPVTPTAAVLVASSNLGDSPTFTVDTPSINAALYSGAVSTTTVEIQNTSSQALDWQVDFIPANFPGGSVPAGISPRAADIGFYATGPDTDLPLPDRSRDADSDQPERAAGDVLNTYGNIPPSTGGVVWAEDEVYVITNWEKTLKRYDLSTQQITSSHAIHFGALNATWDGQYIWVGDANAGAPSNVIGYDTNGQMVGSFPTSVIGGFLMVAFDGDAFIVAQAFLANPTFWRMDYTGTVLETFTSTLPALDSIEYIPGHAAANPSDPLASLWAHESVGFTLRQLRMDAGSVTEVQQIAAGTANFATIAHDGVDMWLNEWFGLTLKQMDDGISEFAWLSVPGAAGSVAGNSTGTFDVTLDPTGLAGTYPGDVRIRTNSTTQPELRIPTQLDANPAPNIVVAPSSLDFGSVFVGLMPTDSIMVTNNGALPLDITDVTISDPRFITDIVLPATLLPGESDWGYVTFLPESSLVYTGTLSITSNDPDQPILDIPLDGIGVRAPDLEVSDLIVPATGWSGQGAFIEWTVQNAGIASAPAGGWQEAVYLSSDSAAIGTKISDFRPVIQLGPGESYTHIHPVTFPHDIFGDYWFTVRSDELDEVTEFPSEANDRRASIPTLITLTPFPDLIVDSLAVADTVETVLEFEVSWRTTNAGNATTSAPVWIDRVYLSTDSIPGGWNLGGFENLSYLPPSGSYLQAARTVTIPSTVTEGTYWLVVHADQGDAVEERNNEGNNFFARQVYVKKGTFPQPDLEVTRIVAPPTGWSGNNVQVDWTVKNVGTATAGGSGPIDWVLLSPDADPDPHVDLHIGGDYLGAPLEPDSSYDRSISVPLPTDSSGTYYLWVWTDVDIVYDEPDIINNFSQTKPIILTIPPPADLAMTSVFTSRNTVATGDTLEVSWTVQNQGAGPGFVSNWSDAVYLSLDGVVDGSDAYLGKFYHSGFLEPGATYSDSRIVTVPGSLTPGSYQVLTVADVDGQVPEGADISTNVGSWNLSVTFPPDADLVASVQTIGGALTSGTTAWVTWRVDNTGPNATTATSWVDSLCISPDSIVTNGTTIRVAGATHTGVLGAGTHYTETRSFTIPNGSSGRWFVFMKPDVAGSVYEMGNTGNNLAGQGFDVALTPPPDLAFSAFSSAESLTVGTVHAVSWTVQNQGAGNAAGSWTDRVYLSTDQTVDGGDVLIKSAARSASTLLSGQFYQQDFDFTLPTVPGGDYFLLGRTDVTNSVYEHTGEGNNDTFMPVHVTVPSVVLPDLVVDSFVYASGLADSVHFTVRNLGPSATGSSWWTDRVYLSSDNVLDAGTDPIIATSSYVGNLPPGQTYSRSLKASLPNGTDGMFTVFTVTDGSGQLTEVNEGNNTDTSQVNILITPPDLVVVSLVNPDTLVSGQPLTVSWTVQNLGTGLPGTSTWYDGIYLSRDQLLDETDINLGSKRHNTGLGVGDSYSEAVDVTVPLGVSGVHYLFVSTDKNNNVYEHSDEFNNFALDADGAVVELPPLADLIVAAIAPPDTGVTGDSLLVSWSVTNQSNTVQGQWKDAVYLSTDSNWDIGDAFLGDASHTGGLPAGASYSKTVAISAADFNLALETTVPGVTRGDYRVIVRTDIQNNIPETDEVNNAQSSTATMNVDVEELIIQQTKTKSIGFAERHYFRVDVPAGWDTRFDFEVSTGDELDVFVRFGDVPDRVIYDMSASVSGSSTVIVPALGAGQLYVMVYGDFVPGGASFDVTADLIPFGLTGVGPSTVGNAGFVSLRLTGGQLANASEARMTLPGTGVIDAWRVDQVSSATVIASFDLTGVTPGDYDVKVVTTSPDSSELFSAVEVIAGGQADVWPRITAPDAARQLASIDYNVTLRNQGNVDAYDVLTGISITAGAEFRVLLPGEPEQFLVSNGSEILVHTDALGVGETTTFTIRLRADADIEVEVIAVRTNPGVVNSSGGTRVVSTWVTDAADAFSARVAELGSPIDEAAFRSAVWDAWGDPAAQATRRPSTRRVDRQIENTFINAIVAIGAAAPPSSPYLAAGLGDGGPMLADLPPDNSGITEEGLIAAKDETDQIYAAAKNGQGRKVKRGTKLRAARDPNEKVGPEETIVSQWQDIPYTVYFENVPTADAAAQQVFVLDQLDTDLDWRTFRLGEIAFGDDVITVPSGRSFWQTRVTLASGNVLEIDAGVDVVSGLARWTFTTIDPATGLPPTDPDAGFLPPNDENGVGAGHVFYTIRASELAPDGAEILNSADIVFDANDAITTNTVANTLLKTYSDLATTSASGTAATAVFLEGEPIEVRAVVRNLGANATSDFQVAFYNGSVSPANEIDLSYRINTLGVDDERDVSTEWTPQRVTGPQSVVIRSDFADEVAETNEGNNDRVLSLNIAPREYTVEVVAGVNMLSLPLEGTDPVSARDYATLLGATTVIRWDSNGVFETFTPAVDPGDGFTIEPHGGYIVTAAAAQSVMFTGVTNLAGVQLYRGLNVTTLPVQPGAPMSARTYANLTRGTQVVRFNTATDRFEPFIPDFHTGDGFVMRGGEGYIAFADEANFVTFAGKGWLGAQGPQAPWLTAPESPASDEKKEKTAAVFTVTGRFFDERWGSRTEAAGAFTAQVLNKRTGAVLEFETAEGATRYGAAFVDLDGSSGTREGDKLVLSVLDSRGKTVGDPVEYVVNEKDLEQYFARIDSRVTATPMQSALLQNFPNPFNPVTTVRFQLASAGNVRLSIYNVRGQLVKTLVNSKLQAGYYEHKWDGVNDHGQRVSSGVYFYKLSAPGYSQARKMVLLK